VDLKLKIFENLQTDLQPRLFEGPTGDLYVFLYSSGAGVLKFEMDDDPVPTDYRILMDREIFHDVSDARFHFVGESVILSYHEEDHYRVFNLDPEGNTVIGEDPELTPHS
jgi:hypothetical protein